MYNLYNSVVNNTEDTVKSRAFRGLHMSRCICCNALIEYEWNMDQDLCSTCADSVRKALSDDNLIRKDYMHPYVRNGVTQPRSTDYEK